MYLSNYSAKAKVIKSRLVLSDEFQYCIKRGLPVLPGRVCDGVQRMEGIGDAATDAGRLISADLTG